jgi:hypothetical protein
MAMLWATSTFADIASPRFINEVDGGVARQVFHQTFGWFKTLDKEQKSAYYSSIGTALFDAQPGQFVRWYDGDASGIVYVAWQEPRNAGLCKRLHIDTVAYNNSQKVQATACFNTVENTWQWYN